MILTVSNLGDSIPLSNLGGDGGGVHLSLITPDSFNGFRLNFAWQLFHIKQI